MLTIGMASMSAFCPVGNLEPVELTSGEMAEKTNCEIPAQISHADGWCLIVFIVSLVILRRHKKKLLIDLDLSMQTAQDYSGTTD
jgi:hypothetical protein